MNDETPLPLIGSGIAMRALAARAEELRRDVTRPVLIVGARGLGKRFLAQRIHSGSRLGAQPLVVLDARHLTDATVAAALHDASPGTSVLVRHVDHLSLHAQQLLDERTGEQTSIVRVLATATGDIVARVTAGEFRESLYYQLHAWPLMLPALADRDAADLLALASTLLAQSADGDPALPCALDTAAADLLVAQPWNENLREFEASLALAQLRARDEAAIAPRHLPLAQDETFVPSVDVSLSTIGRWHMLRVLQACRGNRTRAARQLGISRMTLISRLKIADDPVGT